MKSKPQITKQELEDIIKGIQENNEPDEYEGTYWYASLLKQLRYYK